MRVRVHAYIDKIKKPEVIKQVMKKFRMLFQASLPLSPFFLISAKDAVYVEHIDRGLLLLFDTDEVPLTLLGREQPSDLTLCS